MRCDIKYRNKSAAVDIHHETRLLIYVINVTCIQRSLKQSKTMQCAIYTDFSKITCAFRRELCQDGDELLRTLRRISFEETFYNSNAPYSTNSYQFVKLMAFPWN